METHRKVVVTVEMNDDYSEYTLKCYINNKEVKSQLEYSLSDCLIELNQFNQDCFEEFDIDSRYDDYQLVLDLTY